MVNRRCLSWQWLLLLLSIWIPIKSYAEGSRDLAPDSTGTVTSTNTINAALAHSHFQTDGFMEPNSDPDERLYVYIREGETMYFGLRRVTYFDGVFGTDNGDLSIIIRENDGTLAASYFIEADDASTDDATFVTPQNGVIDSYARCLAGPEQIVGASGYNALTFSNTGLGDQAFYIEVIQTETDLYTSAVTNPAATGVIDVPSTYDLWDFSVYDGSTERPGRLYSKNWGINARSFDNDFSEDFSLFVAVPSTVAGNNAGFYIKRMDLAGVEPYVVHIYANNVGLRLDRTSDQDGDTDIDFEDQRRSIAGAADDAQRLYDIFVNNPDIELYPTTTLPTVNITDAYFYCNQAGTGGEAAVTFTTNSSGFIALIIDLNGQAGYQAGSTDVIIEQEVTVVGTSAEVTMRWDGIDGLGTAVPNGTQINITGRFTAGPFHLPLYDPERNLVGIDMVDVRPQTSFDLVYWDDRSAPTRLTNSLGVPNVQLTGTDAQQHVWDGAGNFTGGSDHTVNTWSFGFYQANTQDVPFSFICDYDDDGISIFNDLDNDNDGVSDAVEGAFLADADGDAIPNFLDSDFTDFTDVNDDGVNDNFDSDLDGIPDALDLDSDNDGIPDMVENGLSDTDFDGTVDNGSGITDGDGNGWDNAYDNVGAGGTPVSLLNQDNDGFSNYLDIDSDNDGIVDAIESGETVDPTTGLIAGFNDGNNNGWDDDLENVARALPNDDGGVLLNYLDIDSDNDGILDNREGQSTSGFIDPATPVTGTVNYDVSLTVTDADGFQARHTGTVSVTSAGGTTNFTGSTVGGVNDVFIEAESGSLGSNWQTVNLGGRSGGTYIQPVLGNNSTGSAPTGVNDRVSYTFDVSQAGDYEVYFLVNAPSGGDDSFWVRVNGGQWYQFNGIDGAWEWDQVHDSQNGEAPVSFLISSGTNTLDIAFREDGTQLDRILVSRDNSITGSAFGSLPTAAITVDGTSGTDPFSVDLNSTGSTTGAGVSYAWDFGNGQTSTAANPTAISFPGPSDQNQNGLSDLYDPARGGTLITPTDTDSDGTPDYRDEDTDDDGVDDFIEGWDANTDGFSDQDADNDNDLSTNANFALDDDNDGLRNAFDVSGGAPIQNTDGADEPDWRDTNDDNDAFLTNGEDANLNNNWADDKTQGQPGSGGMPGPNSPPDYLFNADFDGDGVGDISDVDADNDGILDIDETLTPRFRAVVAPILFPFIGGPGLEYRADQDLDGDGELNYVDLDDGGLPSNADANGDGVVDVYDTDLDGIPDFLDLDSDNDGIYDAVEANGGSVPANFITATGQFNFADPDGDGLMSAVDNDPNDDASPSSTLSNPDSDGDGNSDHNDIDSDADGITDNIEGMSSAAYVIPSGNDTDADGLDDAYDPNNGGTLVTPVNTDGVDQPDYLDDDTDNDGVPDVVEGDDTDQNGIGDWDVTGADDNDLSAEPNDDTDADGDGLADIFDEFDASSTESRDNVTTAGTFADLQNTDRLDERDWRDTNDDNDNLVTADEDANTNNIFYDDLNDDPTANTPDYLFTGDFDDDQIADINDRDSDNDGIPDVDEDGGQPIDPSGDEDNDGIPNFRDSNDAAVTGVLTSTVDANSDGVYDVFDKDLDGTPDFRDLDSDNDGIPDLVEAGGTDTDGDGVADDMRDDDQDGIPNSADIDFVVGGTDTDGDDIIDAADVTQTGGTDSDGDGIDDNADPDSDGDGLSDTYDTNPSDNTVFTSNLPNRDTDGDGINNFLDLDADNDGITDLFEANGVDANGDGRLDNLTDSDGDGFADLHDSSTGGTALTVPDTDNDRIADYLDSDTDNDGIPDPLENGGIDANSDGIIDGFATDTDNDGLADEVDPDNGGTPLTGSDTDNDGISDFRDLDADNDALQDILEAGGVDADNDGRVDTFRDSDGDGIPDNVDWDIDGDGAADNAETGATGNDANGNQIDDGFDVAFTAGNDDDGDGIDNTYDLDVDGDGYDDNVEANPYGQTDLEGDGLKNFRDLDSDGDGIPDVIENGEQADPALATILNFADGNNNGWNDAQEGPGNGITPPDSDLGYTGYSPGGAYNIASSPDGFPDYLDIDSDDDGIPDNIEAQTQATYQGISENDTDGDGLDDNYDPNNGGTLITPPDTDNDGLPDYRDGDADGDGVPDIIEGDNEDRSQFADWDTDNDNDPSDEAGYKVDNDDDGLMALFDIDFASDASNVTGSSSDGQDSDVDGIWDFQDTDDDGDGLLTASSGPATDPATNEDTSGGTGDNNPTNDFDDDAEGIIPNYLFGNEDPDDDGITNQNDLDSDNDGVRDTDEVTGSVTIDPSGDIDGDNVPNGSDEDIDGDNILNVNDPDADGDGVADAFNITDSNADGVGDEFDQDLDGIPSYLDLDSDNDGIPDVLENGFTDANQDGRLNEGTPAAITDADLNGLDDALYTVNTGNVSFVSATPSINQPNATNAMSDPATRSRWNGTNDVAVYDFGQVLARGTRVVITASRNNTADKLIDVGISTNTTGPFTTIGQLDEALMQQTPTTDDFTFILSENAQYIELDMVLRNGGGIDIYSIAFEEVVMNQTPPDADGDGLPNLFDLDADGDGITDNIEGQPTGAGYTAPTVTDADADGWLDVYDPSVNAANYITPTQSDTDGIPDYLDTDADGDGVEDLVEAFDNDRDGYGSWDSDDDFDLTDELNNAFDQDGDGISFIFDSQRNSNGTLANISGSNAELQDTDGDGVLDFRDPDDDYDGLLTINEDFNSNTNFADDFTQNGTPVPDYLFQADLDGDGLFNTTDATVDLDSDNDGIPDADEYAGATYGADSGTPGPNSGTPFGDEDGDGVFNYIDPQSTGFTDANGDGVDDRVDRDRDGIPNFFDLDSDNDGILDIVEGNGGEIPTDPNYDANLGRYSFTGGDATDDFDNDGLYDPVDANVSGGTNGTAAPNPNSDSDGLSDFLDLDADDDGVPDNREAVATGAFITPTAADTDNDGILDVFDLNNGGIQVDPIDTDNDGTPDYRDTDSDGDGVLDIVEAWDNNSNGFSDEDSDNDRDLTDETGYGPDNDNDGIRNLFDNFTGSGINNLIANAAPLQDSDGDGQRDIRDTDDDGDGYLTAAEDFNGNNNWTDDFTQGGGIVPDYLSLQDNDRDRVSDLDDQDNDNDGVPDAEEFLSFNGTSFVPVTYPADASAPPAGVTSRSTTPLGDEDGDGLFNYQDSDATGFTDTNSDGIDDRVDYDLDGVPNFFDLDSDNDGIPDVVEAGGTDANNDGRLDGITDSDNDGLFDNVDVDATGGTDTDGDGIDNIADVDQTGGTDDDGDGIDDNFDLDTDRDGVQNVVDTGEGGVALANGDFDGDGLRNVFDLDSDNDGIVDLVEASANGVTDGDGLQNNTADTDGDGWSDAVDSDNGGTALPVPDTDLNGSPDFLDLDSDGDALLDFAEGFDDDNLNNFSENDYIARANAYEAANGNPGEYGTSNAELLTWLYPDSDGDDWNNFLDPDAPQYLDADNDGIINLFDLDNNGNFYGGVSGIPGFDTNGIPNVRDPGSGTPLPLDLLVFTAERDDQVVLVNWETANEVDMSHFEVERSHDGRQFQMIGSRSAQGGLENTYRYVDDQPQSGYNYYRLKMVESDGSFSYSKVQVVEMPTRALEVVAYPNPAADDLHIESSQMLENARYQLMDMQGRSVLSGDLPNDALHHTLNLRRLPSGVYHLVILHQEGQQAFRIIKR